MKRVFDVTVSLVLIVLFLPVFLVVSVLVRLDSRGPVLFRHRRVGMGGRPFDMKKFRSMVHSTDSTGPYYTVQGDSRITKVGGWLRKTSLDELPQLFNVLVGEMSLVGPRPNVFEQEKLYSEEDWERRHRVRPGITGWAQVHGRNAATLEERTARDLEYVERQSFGLDLKILWMTALQVVFRGSF